MKKYGFLIGLVVLVGLGIFAISSFGTSTINTRAKYCGSDGKVTDKKPIQSHRSYCLSATHAKLLSVSAPNKYVFSIIDDQGESLKDFETVHEKIMHVIVVRKDLAEFQHVHPDFDTAAGSFTFTDLTLPSDGEYRVFADFTPRNAQKGPDGMSLGATIYEDVTAGDGSKYAAQPLGSETRDSKLSSYVVSLTVPAPVISSGETRLAFTIQKEGEPLADLKPYLGAYGHVVVLREGTLEFLHGHPMDETVPSSGEVDFMTTFSRPGKYKVFGQFQTPEELLTADFVVNVEDGAAAEPTMDHGSMGH